MEEMTMRARQIVMRLLARLGAGEQETALLRQFPTHSGLAPLPAGTHRLLLAHTPAVFAAENRITVVCGLFHLLFRGEELERRLGRVDAEFSVEDGQLRCRAIRFRDLLSFAPVAARWRGCAAQLPEGEAAAAETELENLAASTAFHLDGRELSKNVRLLWEGREICGREAADAFLRGSRTAALLLTTPVLTADAGCWRAIRYAGAGDGVQEQFGVLSCRFAREDGAVRICELRWESAATVRDSTYAPNTETPIFPVRLPAQPQAVPAADAAALGNLMLRWITALQTGTLREFYRVHMTKDAPRVALHAKEAVGCEAVERDMERMDNGYLEMPMRSPICHTCTTPFFAVDGDTAEGFWLDNNYTNWAQVTGVREPQQEVTYLTAVNVYHHTFRREAGEWKLAQFRWRSVFSMTPLRHRPFESAGWVGEREEKAWPALPEKG